MVRQAHHRFSLGYFIIPFLFPALFSCAGADSGSQFTSKLQANPFVSELYGDSTKTLALTAESGSHIAWMGLDWSGDYKFFKINEITVNGSVMAPNVDGPQALYENITLLPGSSDASQFYVRLTYSPLAAINAETKPHKAYLLIGYDKPNLGTVRIELTGYTRGICDEDTGETCNFSDTGGLTPQVYKLVGNTMDIYVCHPQTTERGIANHEKPNTRYDAVSLDAPFTFYKSSSDNTVHIVRNDAAGQDPTVPLFQIPLSDPQLPIHELDAELRENLNITCPVDEAGGFRCEGVQLNVFGGAVQMSDFIVSTGSETPTSSQCPDFGTVDGAAGIDGDTMTVVAFGTITGNQLDLYIDAVVVAVMPLEKQ